MESLQKAYEAELKDAGAKIKGVVENALKIFDSDDLFQKSIRYALSNSKVHKESGRFLQQNSNES